MRSASRQKHLVVAGQHRVHEGFAGEVVSQTDLATFENVADPAGQRVLLSREQFLLVAVHLGDELIQEVHFGQAADIVLGLLFPFFVATVPTTGTLPT